MVTLGRKKNTTGMIIQGYFTTNFIPIKTIVDWVYSYGDKTFCKKLIRWYSEDYENFKKMVVEIIRYMSFGNTNAIVITVDEVSNKVFTYIYTSLVERYEKEMEIEKEKAINTIKELAKKFNFEVTITEKIITKIN